jgi:hypothetical protein
VNKLVLIAIAAMAVTGSANAADLKAPPLVGRRSPTIGPGSIWAETWVSYGATQVRTPVRLRRPVWTLPDAKPWANFRASISVIPGSPAEFRLGTIGNSLQIGWRVLKPISTTRD